MRSISCLSPNTFSDHNLYKCGLCNNFVDPKSVVNHVQNYETCLKINVNHPCSVCKRPFNSRRAKDNHEKIHNKHRGECFKTILFNNVRDKDHNEILLKASVEGIKNVAVIYKCRCALCFVSEESAIEHMKACSPDINIIKEICQKCNNIFDIRELVKHCYVHMNEGVNSIEVKEMAFPLKQESNDNQGDKPLYRIIQTTDVDNPDAVVDILLILDSDDEQDEENEAEDDRVPSGDEEISMATDSDDEEARVRNDVQENIGEEMRNAEVIIEGTDQNKSQSDNIEAQEQRNNFANEKVTQASHVPNAAEPEIDKIPEDVSRNSNACPNVVSDLFVSPQNIQNDSENPPMLNVISPVINYENPVSLNEEPIERRSTDNDVSLTDDEEPQNLTQINACNSTITCETEYNMATLGFKCVDSSFLLSSSGLIDTPIHNVPENNTTANELNTIVDIKTEFGCELNNTSTPIKSLLDPRDFSSICTRPSLRRGYSADVGSSGQPESVPIKAEPDAIVDDLIDLLTDDEDVPEQFQNSSHDYDVQQSGAESIPFIVPKREVDSVESDNYVAETEGIITDDENNVSADSPNNTLIASNIDRQESNNFNTENEEEANNEVPTKTFIKQSKEGRNERHDDNYGNKDLEMQLRNFLAMIYSRPLTNIHRPNIINIPMKNQSEVMNKTAQNISNDTSVDSDNTFDIDADVTNENKENNTKKREDANIKKHVTSDAMNQDETPEFSNEIVTESATLHQNSIIDNTYEDNEQEISSYADCVMESVLREKEIDGEIHNEMTSKDDSGSVLNVNLRPQKNTLEDATVQSDNSDSKDSNANDNANIHNNNFKENVPVTKNLSAKDTYDKCSIS